MGSFNDPRAVPILHVEAPKFPLKEATQESVGAFDRRRIGRCHADAQVRAREEIERGGRGSGPEINQDVVGVEVLQLARPPWLSAGAEWSCRPARIFLGDEREPLNGRAERTQVFLFQGILLRGIRRDLDPQHGVKCWAGRVGVHQDDLASELGQIGSQVDGEDAVSSPPAPAANGDELLHAKRKRTWDGRSSKI